MGLELKRAPSGLVSVEGPCRLSEWRQAFDRHSVETIAHKTLSTESKRRGCGEARYKTLAIRKLPADSCSNKGEITIANSWPRGESRSSNRCAEQGFGIADR